MSKLLMILMAAALLAGCSSFQWSRLAPPGIVKYEVIADDKPPNPAIEEEIKAYKAEGSSSYPNLSETPTAADRPQPRPKAELDAEMMELREARDALAAGVAADREAANLDAENTEEIITGRDILTDKVEADERAAAREKRRQEAEDNLRQ